jgi:CHAT domain-containing protein
MNLNSKTYKYRFLNIFYFIFVFNANAQNPMDSCEPCRIHDSLMKHDLREQAQTLMLQNQTFALAHFKENPYPYLKMTYQLSLVLYRKENYDTTIMVLSKLLPKINQTIYKDSLIYCEILNLLGINHRSLRHFEEAEHAYKQAETRLIALQPHSNDIYSSLLRNYTLLYADMGKVDKAIEYATRSLSYELPNCDKYWTRFNTLALLHKRKGRFKTALQMMQTTLNQTDPKNEQYVIRLISVSSMYADIQLFDKALELAQQAMRAVITLKGTNSSSYANAHYNLSLLYTKMKQDSLALRHAETACQVAETKQDKITYNQYLAQLGGCYYWVGEQDKGLGLVEKSVQYLDSRHLKQTEVYYWATETLINLYRNKGLIQKAILLNESTLAVFKTVWSEIEDKYLNSTMRLIQLYQQQQQFDKSVDLLKTLANTMNTQIIHNLDVLDEESKTLFVSKLLTEYHHLLLSQLQRTQNKDIELIRAAYQAELGMKEAVLGSTQTFRQIVKQSKDSSVQKWDKQRLLLTQSIEKAYSQQPPSKSIDSLKSVLTLLEAKLMSAIPELKTIAHPDLNEDSIRVALPPNSCAIEFTHFKYYNAKNWTDTIIYGAILLKPSSQPQWIPLCNEAALSNLLKTNPKPSQLYASAEQKRGNDASLDSILPSTTLYELVWKPLEKHLSGIKTIYYAPSGLLHRIAFAALKPDENTYLLDQYDLQAVSSTKNLFFKRPNSSNALDFNPENTFLIYGGIRYDADSTRLSNAMDSLENRATTPYSWQYLSGTKRELDKIATLFKNKKIFIQVRSDFAASEADFKKITHHAFSPHVIHFATHGFFNQKAITPSLNDSNSIFKSSSNPMIRSGLVMAGANRVWMGEPSYQGFEDGILTAYEISLMNLSNTKLVVLSACETGLGDIQGNEGVYGLQRAFKMAGVEAVLMSLWQVPDKQTAQLMESFYTYLLENQPIQKAFAQAQQDLKSKHENAPYYWAGFVLVR